MMKFLNKYTPNHYNAYHSIIIKIIGDHKELDTWIKGLETNDILIWLNTYQHLKQDDVKFFEESSILTTLTIKLFSLELDVLKVELKNGEIIKLLERVKKALTTELAFRKEIIDDTPKYTLIKDMDEN